MLVPYGARVIQVDGHVPFTDAIYVHLHLDNLNLDKLAHNDHYKLPYLAWETVRKSANPFFVKGTGFEGYLIGRVHSPEEALDHILQINHAILEGIARRYRFEYNFRQRLFKTLTQEIHDQQCIHIWSTCLGMTLAKLRCQVANCQAACTFRNETYHIVDTLPTMQYAEKHHTIEQHYELGIRHRITTRRIAITRELLNPKDQDAWLVADLIGSFGHPLVRQVLNVAA